MQLINEEPLDSMRSSLEHKDTLMNNLTSHKTYHSANKITIELGQQKEAGQSKTAAMFLPGNLDQDDDIPHYESDSDSDHHSKQSCECIDKPALEPLSHDTDSSNWHDSSMDEL